MILAFLSQLSSIGKGLQKVGVQSLPELSGNPAVLWQYLSSRTWRNGMLLDILGAIFGFLSLSVLPISVAQPIFCNGLVLLACYSHFYLHEQVPRALRPSSRGATPLRPPPLTLLGLRAAAARVA